MASHNEDVIMTVEDRYRQKMYQEYPQLAIIKSRYPNVTWLKYYFESDKKKGTFNENVNKGDSERGEMLTWKDFYEIMYSFNDDYYGMGPDKLATVSNPDMVIDIYELLFIINCGPIEDGNDKFKKIDTILEKSVSYGNVKVSDYLYTTLQEYGNSTIFKDCHYCVIPRFENEEIMVWAVGIKERLQPFIFKSTDECVDIFRRHEWSTRIYNDNLYMGEFITPEHESDLRDRNEIVIDRLSHIYRNYDFYERSLKYEELDNIEKLIDTIPDHSLEKGILAKTIYEALPEKYKEIIIPYMEKHGIANTMTKSASKR